MMAQEVIIDPFLLCLPNPCNSLEQLEDFISAIAGWRGFLDRADTCVLLSDSVKIALNTDCEFPHRHRLAELIKKFNCALADANTISKVANSILERTPALEDYFGINDIYGEADTFELTPAVILDRLKPNCRSAFRGDLLIAGVKDNECVTENIESRLMVASGKMAVGPLPTSIFIKADVLVSKDSDRDSVLQISLSQSIPVTFSHDQLIDSLDLWAIWDGASSEEAVRICVESCINNLISSGVNADARCDYAIGSGFVASLQLWGANSRRDYAMVTIESCARIVLGIAKNPIIEFRESAAGNAKQRTREDGASAFRTHLTMKGVALRLMFWRRADGTVEFANIGGKGELEIS